MARSIESLKSEMKGNLFEYLVGLEISKVLGVKAQYLIDLNEQLKQQLQDYEQRLRISDEELLNILKRFSKLAVGEILDFLPRGEKVLLVGKIKGNSLVKSFFEGDIVLFHKRELIPISIKLIKKGSFVNTKSGGVQSFIRKYFSQFDNNEVLQESLNFSLEEAFQDMGRELYQKIGEQFNGKFDRRWTDSYEEYPGALPEEFREIVQLFYFRVLKELFRAFEIFSQKSKKEFLKSLLILAGFSHEKSIQIKTSYSKRKDEKLIYEKTSIMNYETFQKEFNDCKICKLKEDERTRSSFEIEFKKYFLQIRLKPMKKFTVPGLKVNCSIKAKSL